MKHFDFETALNALKVGKQTKLNEIREDLPEWVQGKDFITLFLPYLKIVGDSREQDKWIEQACEYYGIAFEWRAKDRKTKTENLKEGDYSFIVCYGNREYDYVGKVAYERKGSISELYRNCTGYNHDKQSSDRDRIDREFSRFADKGYEKVVLMLEFGEKLIDLINMHFEYRASGGIIQDKNTHYVVYSALMSWKQPNNKNFDIIQSHSHKKLFWLFLQDCFYFFRNEIRNECKEKNILQGE